MHDDTISLRQPDAAELRGHALALAATIAEAPPETVRAAKRLLRGTAHLPVDEAFRAAH